MLILVAIRTFSNSNSKERQNPLVNVSRENKIEVPKTSVVAANLAIPWSLAFLPSGSIIFTQRPGEVKMIDEKGNLTTLANLSSVKHIGEGGLLGLAVHPHFANNKTIYLYYTFANSENGTLNRVSRFKLESGLSTWAPSGTVILNNSIFLAGLRGSALFEAKIANGKVELKEHFKNEFGRIRDVILGPDGLLYIATNNRDGRGTPLDGDDKIVRINPEKL